MNFLFSVKIAAAGRREQEKKIGCLQFQQQAELVYFYMHVQRVPYFFCFLWNAPGLFFATQIYNTIFSLKNCLPTLLGSESVKYIDLPLSACIWQKAFKIAPFLLICF